MATKLQSAAMGRTARQDAGDIRPLTALRFFAALWVVLYAYWPRLAGPAAPMLVQKGYLGVELFFVLSGFILCHVYLRGFGEGRGRYGAFLWARLARVYPVHLATLAAMAGLAAAASLAGIAVDPNLRDWTALPAHLALLHAWGVVHTAAFNHPSWSISAEWFAYLAFPLFAALAWRLRGRPWLFLGLAVLLVLGVYPAFERAAGFPLTEATFRWGALRIVPCFLLGCALHGLWRSGVTNSWNGAVVCLGALAWIGLSAGLGGPDNLTLLGLGGLILGLAVLAAQGSSVLTQGPLIYLGEISYSIYMVCALWEILFVHGAQKLLNLPAETLPAPLWGLLLAGVLIPAAAAFHLVEKPARSALRAWFDSRRGRPLVTVVKG